MPSECPIACTVDPENEEDKTPASILCDVFKTPAKTANNNDSGDSSNKVLVEGAALLHTKDVQTMLPELSKAKKFCHSCHLMQC